MIKFNNNNIINTNMETHNNSKHLTGPELDLRPNNAEKKLIQEWNT